MTTTTNSENNGTTVNLRIEGATNIIFDGMVTIKSGGTHKCDGNSGNFWSITGPTVPDAIDTASKLHEFTWNYKFDGGHNSCLITSIGDTSQNNGRYWLIFINDEPIQKGMCRQKVKENDKIVVKLDNFNAGCR